MFCSVNCWLTSLWIAVKTYCSMKEYAVQYDSEKSWRLHTPMCVGAVIWAQSAVGMRRCV